MTLRPYAAALAASVLLTACATAPMAPPADDAAAKTFTHSEDKAGLYVFRDELFGAAIGMPVSVNGYIAGKTAANTYFYFELPPGRYTIGSHTENESFLPATLIAGESFYVWQEVKMGFMTARSKLHAVDSSRGQAGVMSSRRIADESGVAERLANASVESLEGNQQLQTPLGAESTRDRLEELQRLEQDGLISDAEYNEKRSEILSDL